MNKQLKYVSRMQVAQCGHCIRDLEYRMDMGSGCEILLEGILGQGLPDEWAEYRCDAFEPEP